MCARVCESNEAFLKILLNQTCVECQRIVPLKLRDGSRPFFFFLSFFPLLVFRLDAAPAERVSEPGTALREPYSGHETTRLASFGLILDWFPRTQQFETGQRRRVADLSVSRLGTDLRRPVSARDHARGTSCWKMKRRATTGPSYASCITELRRSRQF